MLVIVDYGMGNLASVKNMIKYIGYDSVISKNPEVIGSADKLILPGVGHFGRAMDIINSSGLREVLDKAVIENKTPIFGICLGMQLLLSHSEEGDADGLGWIPGNICRFNPEEMGGLKVPHMGWDYVKVEHNSPILEGVNDKSRYYFVHSYYASCDNRDNALATTDYGIIFDSVVGKDNIFGTQFHPEKSHKFGMNLLENFLRL